MPQWREIPNPDEVPESLWDSGWRWWVAVGAALVLVGILAVLSTAILEALT